MIMLNYVLIPLYFVDNLYYNNYEGIVPLVRVAYCSKGTGGMPLERGLIGDSR